jgi:hypothetical protein
MYLVVGFAHNTKYIFSITTDRRTRNTFTAGPETSEGIKANDARSLFHYSESITRIDHGKNSSDHSTVTSHIQTVYETSRNKG